MKNESIATEIASGEVHFTNRMESISDVEWTRHAEFKGVYLKNMIKGADTGGLFSSHLVKIEPDCRLENHIHETQMELHEVIEGDGSCLISGNTIAYRQGKMAVIPKGENHMVQAGENGLVMLAKFFPSLV